MNRLKKYLLTAVFALLSVLSLMPFGMQSHGYAVVPSVNRIVDWAGEADFSVYLSLDGTLYASGANASGQLGRGFKDDGKKIEPLTKKILTDVESFCTGTSGFVLALTKSGELYGWGANEYGQIGGGITQISNGNSINSPEKISMPEGASRPSSLVAGARHSLILTQDGKVYTLGHNNMGQLGLSLPVQRQSLISEPNQIDSQKFGNEKIVSVATCEFTSFALSENGNVYAWGSGNSGLLTGLNGDSLELNAPVKTALTGIKKISARSTTVMALDENGKVFIWGSNTFGQFGLPLFLETFSQEPLRIDDFYDTLGNRMDITVRDIVSGGITNFVLDTEGRVFSFGMGGIGQLGYDIYSINSPFNGLSKITAPTLVSFYEPLDIESDGETVKGKIPVDKSKAKNVRIDRFAGSVGVRTFALDDSGNMWSWGDNANGLVSSGNQAVTDAPVLSTLFRDEPYDNEIAEKNYLLRPIIGLSIIFGGAILLLGWAEIKKLQEKRRYKRENAI